MEETLAQLPATKLPKCIDIVPTLCRFSFLPATTQTEQVCPCEIEPESQAPAEPYITLETLEPKNLAVVRSGTLPILPNILAAMYQ